MMKQKQIEPQTLTRYSAVFSVAMFALVLIVGGAVFMLSMRQIIRDGMHAELATLLANERVKLKVPVGDKVSLVMQLAESPRVRRYFAEPSNPELKRAAHEEFAWYRKALLNGIIFWVNDIDKIFYSGDAPTYVVNPDDTACYWYNMTLYETEKYNFNINYNPRLNVIKQWINVPVFDIDDPGKPIGMLGTAIEIPTFLDAVYNNYMGGASLYFFNASGEITATAAKEISLVTAKRRVAAEFGTVGEMIEAEAKSLAPDEFRAFTTPIGEVGICVIPAFGWYAFAVIPRTASDYNAPMTYLFLAMLAAIALILAVLNIFIGKLSARLAEYIRQIERFGVTDTLTGLLNRRGFDERAAAEWNRAMRRRDPLSVLLIDADNFKAYNDKYGHVQGDALLKTIAAIFSQNARRAGDVAARWGGEEFVVLLPNTDTDAAAMVAERIRKEVENAVIPLPDGTPTQTTMSIGIHTTVPTTDGKLETLFAVADKMLYKAKKSGKNTVCAEWL